MWDLVRSEVKKVTDLKKNHDCFPKVSGCHELFFGASDTHCGMRARLEVGHWPAALGSSMDPQLQASRTMITCMPSSIQRMLMGYAYGWTGIAFVATDRVALQVIASVEPNFVMCIWSC